MKSQIVWRACEIHFIPTPLDDRLPVYRFEVDMERSVQWTPFKLTAKIVVGRIREGGAVAQTQAA
jgi:hypothetical protein